MIEVGVHETFTPAASGGGATTISLTAATDTVELRFSDAFADGQPVSYVMVSSGANAMEVGIGKYTASNQLERTRPTMTWNGTTRNAVSPSKLIFADGTLVDVYAHPIAATVAPPGYTLAGTDGICAPSGDVVVDSGNGTKTIAADTIYVEPYLKEWGNPVDAVVIRFVGTIGSSKLRVALDRVAPDGTRGDRVFETSDWTGVAAAGKAAKELAATTEIPPGWYWITLISDGSFGIYRHGGRRAGGPLGGYKTVGANYIQFATQGGFTSWTVVPSWTLSSLTPSNWIPDGCLDIQLRGV